MYRTNTPYDRHITGLNACARYFRFLLLFHDPKAPLPLDDEAIVSVLIVRLSYREGRSVIL